MLVVSRKLTTKTVCRHFVPRLVTYSQSKRAETTVAPSSPDLSENVELLEKEACLFIDSVFPVRFGTWDLRHYIGLYREEQLIERIKELLSSIRINGFNTLSIEPRNKDGGVFVNFKYHETRQGALEEILKELRIISDTKGGFPTWLGLKQASGSVWLVKGNPWREDMNRFASPMLKVAFDGPDIKEEGLYNLLRPYGRILDLTSPSPGTPGSLRSSIVTFKKVRSAATARNCIHGLVVPTGNGNTRLHVGFERPIKAHAVRDWISGHPRLVLPVLFFLIGTITYTIFDPIRVFSVEAKMLELFDYRKSSAYQWLRKNTVDRFSFALMSSEREITDHNTWKERKDAEDGVRSYLKDFPNTIAFVHGPQGSGKSSMVFSLLKDCERPVLTVDCNELFKASSDSALLSALAYQTGYWPVFPFVNSLNNLIDIASVGIIGQKAGLSSSIETQIREMLEVVGTALKGTKAHKLEKMHKRQSAAEIADRLKKQEAERYAKILSGTWHDPRLDCVSGNGIMCELGIGDELMRPEDADINYVDSIALLHDPVSESSDEQKSHKKTPAEVQELQALPIVVIKNFATKHGKDDVMGVLANWAATLVNNGVAHVIVVSDNRENARVLTQALPSKPLYTVALTDADTSSSLSFVAKKLSGREEINEMTLADRISIEKLGGRASDLETLIHKVNAGQRIEDAVEDIIVRGVNELRRTAFGEGTEDAKALTWSREQAWSIIKQLVSTDEIPYHSTLLEFPFKGDETALRAMEHAELISIGTHNGRPSVIKTGRPVYKYVFQRLASDPVFRATQELSLNTARIASAEATVKSCEEELRLLSELNEPVPIRSGWYGKRNAAIARASYILKKMQAAEATVEKLEAANSDLKKILVKNT